jgi:hypothetical protein
MLDRLNSALQFEDNNIKGGNFIEKTSSLVYEKNTYIPDEPAHRNADQILLQFVPDQVKEA